MIDEQHANIWAGWEIPAKPSRRGPPGSVAFDAAEEDAEAYMPRWEVNLPADPDLAEAELNRAVQLQERANRALDSLPERFDHLSKLAQRSRQISFGIEPVEERPPAALRGPEAEALRLLGILEPHAAVSFGLLELPREAWERARHQFQQAIDKLLRMVSYYAWVETNMGGLLLARTVVGWSGDVDTLWELNLTPEQFNLHNRSLSLAITSRNTLIRSLVSATQGAVKLSAVITTPGGAVLALPIAWKYVDQILSEINKLSQA